MGIRDLVQRKRAQHGGLRAMARNLIGGRSTPRSGEEPEAPGPDARGRLAVARADALAEGQGRAFRVAEHAVAVFRAQGRLFAIDAACAHEDGPLDEGRVDGLVLTCPYHDWRYSLETGRCLTREDRAVACFEVVEAEGWIWVGPRTSEGSAERGGAHDDGLEVLVREI